MVTVLEVLDKGSVTAAHPVPLLFVHGAWHAAWCWDENFLDFFADKGYQALALSLRNHGNSYTKNRRTCSVADWVSDVESVAQTLAPTQCSSATPWGASWCRSIWRRIQPQPEYSLRRCL